MTGVIYCEHTGMAMRDLHFIQGTWVLDQPPIGRGRQVQDLQQNRPVYAVMPDKNDCFVMMMFQDKTDGVCRAGEQVLQGVTLGKPDKMRCTMPKSEKCWRTVLDFFESVPLPRAIIEIDEALEHLARGARRRCNRFTGCNASLQGAGVNGGRMPFASDTLSKRSRLSQPFISEGKFGLASEPFGRDAIDMAMPDEQDPWHLILSCRAISPEKSGRRARGPLRPRVSWRDRVACLLICTAKMGCKALIYFLLQNKIRARQ
ncbi:MAG: hypothetical protein WBG11_04730 [Methylocella sp.]